MWWSVAFAVPSIQEPWRSGHAGTGAAVVVGIEDYAFLPDVPYAAADAAVMADVFTASLGLPPDRVTVLRSGSREQVVDAVVAARAQAGDGPVYVYFAGHGATSPDGGLLLVGDDARPDAKLFVARSVSVVELQQAAGPGSVLWLDTCWAGVGRDGAALLPGARFAVPVYATVTEGEVWTAASPSEVSLPYAPARHGLFTYFLAGGLRGWADGAASEPDGVLGTDEVWAYVERTMRAVGAAQVPRRSGGSDHMVVTGRLEVGPPVSDLPRAGSPIALGPTTAPSLSLVLPLAREGRGARDAVGRATSFEELAGLGLGPEVQRADAKAHAGRIQGIVGLVAAGASFAAAGAIVGAQGAAAASWDEYESLCAQGLRTDSRCADPKPSASAVGPAAASALGAVSLGVSVTGFLRVGAARSRVVDQANEVLR